MPAMKGAHPAVSEDTTLAWCDFVFTTYSCVYEYIGIGLREV